MEVCSFYRQKWLQVVKKETQILYKLWIRRAFNWNNHVWWQQFWMALPGAIIGDGDRKRAPFLVLGLAPWYGTIFLFLEQIAPSPLTYARTCCEHFCGWCAGEMASKIPEICYAFGPQLNAIMSVGILLNHFRRKFLQFDWSKTVSNLGMSRFITDQVVFHCFFYKNFTLLHSKFYICKRLTA